jgi:hypothetical protein
LLLCTCVRSITALIVLITLSVLVALPFVPQLRADGDVVRASDGCWLGCVWDRRALCALATAQDSNVAQHNHHAQTTTFWWRAMVVLAIFLVMFLAFKMCAWLGVCCFSGSSAYDQSDPAFQAAAAMATRQQYSHGQAQLAQQRHHHQPEQQVPHPQRRWAPGQ